MTLKVSGVRHTAHVCEELGESEIFTCPSQCERRQKKKIYFDFSLKMEQPGEQIISTTISRAADTDHMCLRVITGSSINVDPGDSSITETNIPPT